MGPGEGLNFPLILLRLFPYGSDVCFFEYCGNIWHPWRSLCLFIILFCNASYTFILYCLAKIGFQSMRFSTLFHSCLATLPSTPPRYWTYFTTSIRFCDGHFLSFVYFITNWSPSTCRCLVPLLARKRSLSIPLGFLYLQCGVFHFGTYSSPVIKIE